MKTKKIITLFLILVLLLQILPIRQVVQYFFVDNITNEELVSMGKAAAKNCSFLDEDHKDMPGILYELPQISGILNTSSFHYNISISPFYSLEVQTPPPNTV